METMERPAIPPSREAIEYSICEVLNSHSCEFNQELFKQSNGGAIGNRLTSYVAALFMIWWDERYVDDCNVLV